MARHPIVRKYLTPILMESIAWNLMNKLSVKKIARLNTCSPDTVYRILRLPQFNDVMETVKKEAFSEIRRSAQDSVALAVEKFQQAAPDIADRIIELAKSTSCPAAVRHAAGVTVINKGGVQAVERGSQAQAPINEKVIVLIRETEEQMANATTDDSRSALPVPR